MKKIDKQALKISKRMMFANLAINSTDAPLTTGYVWRSPSNLASVDFKAYRKACRKIGYEYYEIINEVMYNRIFNFNILQIVRKCISDGFPIQEYLLHEIPYGDSECIIIDFVNKNDYENYHIKGDKNINIRCIDFLVSKDWVAKPLKNVGYEQIPINDCLEAMYKSEL